MTAGTGGGSGVRSDVLLGFLDSGYLGIDVILKKRSDPCIGTKSSIFLLAPFVKDVRGVQMAISVEHSTRYFFELSPYH
jgi:hypothetical protein